MQNCLIHHFLNRNDDLNPTWSNWCKGIPNLLFFNAVLKYEWTGVLDCSSPGLTRISTRAVFCNCLATLIIFSASKYESTLSMQPFFSAKRISHLSTQCARLIYNLNHGDIETKKKIRTFVCRCRWEESFREQIRCSKLLSIRSQTL